MKQHLEVCNVKKLIDARPECIIEGINRGDINIEAPKHIPLTLLDQNVVDDVIKKVEAAAGINLTLYLFIFKNRVFYLLVLFIK